MPNKITLPQIINVSEPETMKERQYKISLHNKLLQGGGKKKGKKKSKKKRKRKKKKKSKKKVGGSNTNNGKKIKKETTESLEEQEKKEVHVYPTNNPKVSNIERSSKFHYAAEDITEYYGTETKENQDVYFIKDDDKDFKNRIKKYIEKGIKIKKGIKKLEHGDIIFVGFPGRLGQENGFVIVNLSQNFPDKFIFTDSFVTDGDIHDFDEKYCNNVWENIDFEKAILEIIMWKKTMVDAINWNRE